MMSKIQIPLYRAKKIDGDEYVNGYFDPTLLEGVIHTINGKHILVDPSTLSISFGDEETWYLCNNLKDQLMKELLDQQRFKAESKMNGI